jgi:phosphoribosylamine--glycine ligase
MNILLIGSGGREHALAWKISQSPLTSRLFCAPGNPGIASLAECVPLSATDLDGLLRFARAEKIDLTVVGPERPLAGGVVDLFVREGLTIFGPTRDAAELEWSKVFAKNFMTRHGIPTADCRIFDGTQLDKARKYLESSPVPIVLKADGLAAGKGVSVCRSRKEALAALHQMTIEKAFGSAGARVVIEECMSGEEASVFALSDGQHYMLLAPAQDHKRIFDSDLGKNTGGMGAYAPASCVTPEILRDVEQRIIGPTLAGMAAEGRPYHGCLYVGLMLTEMGPRVVEYNCRFGDPEAQVVLPLFDGDLVAALYASSTSGLSEGTGVKAEPGATAVCVVLASGGYPDSYSVGKKIHGLEELEALPGILPFHAGTRREGDALVTAGGRVLGITAVCTSGGLQTTIAKAYQAVEKLNFEGMHFRHDIGRKGLAQSLSMEEE